MQFTFLLIVVAGILVLFFCNIMTTFFWCRMLERFSDTLKEVARLADLSEAEKAKKAYEAYARDVDRYKRLFFLQARPACIALFLGLSDLVLTYMPTLPPPLP